jgi:hypothetical protein
MAIGVIRVSWWTGRVKWVEVVGVMKVMAERAPGRWRVTGPASALRAAG